MLDYFAGSNAWDALRVAAILTPVLIFVWIVMTVTALHRREVLFLAPRLDLDQPDRVSASLGHHELQRLEPTARPERAL
jgi:hypothetical protein